MSARLPATGRCPAVATAMLCGHLPAPAAQHHQLHALHTPDAGRAGRDEYSRFSRSRGLDRPRRTARARLSLWFLTEYGADTVETAGPRAETRRRLSRRSAGRRAAA